MEDPVENVVVNVYRYDPDCSEPPHHQAYKVPKGPTTTVLEALLHIYYEVDSTLAFRFGCRYKSCGLCAMKVNGRPSLACLTPLEDGQTIEPLDNVPLLRDLVIDREPLLGDLSEHHLFLDQIEDWTTPATIVETPEYRQIMRCADCLACVSVCPLTTFAPDIFDGPYLSVKVAQLSLDPRDTFDRVTQGERLASICSLCKRCDAVCPIGIPISEYNTRAKHAYAKQRGQKVRDRLLGHAGWMQKLGSTFAPLSNLVLASGPFRWASERLLGIDSRVSWPELKRRSLSAQMRRRSSSGMAAGSKRKVVYFAGCYAEYVDPDLGMATIDVLERNGVEVVLAPAQCCGLPLIGNGDLDAARRLAETNLDNLGALVQQGYDVVVSCTSCSLTLKNEYAGVLGLDEGKAVASRVYDLGDYLRTLHQAGELSVEFEPVPRKLAYHMPCHLHAQGIGLPLVELLEMVPELEVQVMDAGCCGLAGSFGFKHERYEASMAIGEPLFKEVRAIDPEAVLSECGGCRLQIQHGTSKRTEHPIAVLHQAYGLDRDDT